MSGIIKKYVFIIIAVIAYFTISLLPTPTGLEPAGQRSIALMVAAVIIWATEAIPVGYVSLAFPMITWILGVAPIGEVLKNFINASIIFMICTQFISQAFVSTGVGNRVATKFSFLFGTKPKQVLLSFIMVSGVVSMFIGDIPVAVVFGGIAYDLLKLNNCEPGKSKFGLSMMIGIPIAAAIGGFATPVGSGLNQLTIIQLQSVTGITIDFLQWSIVGIPMSIILLVISWLILSALLPAEIDHVKGSENAKDQDCGPLKVEEKKFIVIFAITIIAWVTSPITNLDNNMVAAISVCAMALAGIEVLKADKVNSIGWSGVLLSGGATATATTLTLTGASQWIADLLSDAIGSMGPVMVIFCVIIFAQLIHFLIPTGGALVATVVPIMAAVAASIGMSPIVLTLIIGYTVSNCFLMPLDPIPLSTYGYGYWKLFDMTKYGVPITIVWSIILFGFMVLLHTIGFYPAV